MKCAGCQVLPVVAECWVITDHLSRGGWGWSLACPARPPRSLDPALADGVRVSTLPPVTTGDLGAISDMSHNETRATVSQEPVLLSTHLSSLLTS